MIARIEPLDSAAMDAMRQRLDQLTKPRGSLGRLEALAVQLAGIAGSTVIEVGQKTVIVAAGDHGVAAEGVSAYPQEVTGQMLRLFAAGRAAINLIAGVVGAEVIVVDAGVAGPVDEGKRVVSLRIGAGTRNVLQEPAMTREQATQAIEGGIAVAEAAIEGGASVLATGDMGIANTTAAAAITAALTGADPEWVVGRGTGIDDETLAQKRRVVRAALERHRGQLGEPLQVLACLGGFEIGVLVGVILAAAASRRPVVLDGVVSGAGALVAWALAPAVRSYLIAGHRSTEPAHSAALGRLGLVPLLDLELRLGEGTGAALALPLVEAAARVAMGMWTFAEAGVSSRER